MNNSEAFSKAERTTLSKYKAMSLSNINKNYETIFDQQTARKKKISVFHRNNDVVFPKE